jgi:hypothetical protein
MRTLLLAALLPFAIAAAPAAAPLPPHWEPNLRYRAEPPPSIGPFRGVYGRGVSHPTPEIAAHFVQSRGEPVCRGGPGAQQAWLERLGAFEAEFWFYATRRQAVIFLRTAVLPSPNGCDQPPAYVHRIERALIADGVFHLIEIPPGGPAELAGSRPIGRPEEDPLARTGFGLFYAMATRDTAGHGIGPQIGSENDRVAGIPVRCRRGGFGYMFSRTCLSRRGPTRGMPILVETSDDSQRIAWTEFREVMPEATLDGRLFDFELRWRPRGASEGGGEGPSPQPPA